MKSKTTTKYKWWASIAEDYIVDYIIFYFMIKQWKPLYFYLNYFLILKITRDIYKKLSFWLHIKYNSILSQNLIFHEIILQKHKYFKI